MPKVMVLRRRAFGKWLGHECGALMNGSRVLIRKVPCPFCSVRIQGEVYNPMRGFTQPCQHPDSGLAASRSVRNKFLLLMSYTVCAILLQSSWDTAGKLTRYLKNSEKTNDSYFSFTRSYRQWPNFHNLKKHRHSLPLR